MVSRAMEGEGPCEVVAQLGHADRAVDGTVAHRVPLSAVEQGKLL